MIQVTGHVAELLDQAPPSRRRSLAGKRAAPRAWAETLGVLILIRSIMRVGELVNRPWSPTDRPPRFGTDRRCPRLFGVRRWCQPLWPGLTSSPLTLSNSDPGRHSGSDAGPVCSSADDSRPRRRVRRPTRRARASLRPHRPQPRHLALSARRCTADVCTAGIPS